jgi:hypothetical protein
MRQAPTPYTAFFLRKLAAAHERRREDEGGEYHRQLHLIVIYELMALFDIQSQCASVHYSKMPTSLKHRYIFKCSRYLDYGGLCLRYAEAQRLNVPVFASHLSKISAVILFSLSLVGSRYETDNLK